MKYRVSGLVACLFILAVLSCKKDSKIETPVQVSPPVEEPKNTALTFNFKAFLNNLPLNISSTKFFTNLNNDSITVSKFDYYISNIKLKTTGGLTYSEPESYHLIRHGDTTSTSFTIKNLPEGFYNSIEFVIGVDSTRNVSGAQTGALDPGNTMFWDWNNGYIFLKLEGDFKTFTTPAGSNYAMHIGGYSGAYNCLKTCSFTGFSNNINVLKGKTPVVYFNVMVDEIFKNPSVIDIDSYFSVQTGKLAQTVADNYADMFIVDKVIN